MTTAFNIKRGKFVERIVNLKSAITKDEAGLQKQREQLAAAEARGAEYAARQDAAERDKKETGKPPRPTTRHLFLERSLLDTQCRQGRVRCHFTTYITSKPCCGHGGESCTMGNMLPAMNAYRRLLTCQQPKARGRL